MTQPSDRATAYTGTARTFHWAVAILVLLMLYGGWTLEDLPKEERAEVIRIHAGIGLTVLVLMLGRLFWRLKHPAPGLPADMPGWQQAAARGAHHALYFCVILQPLLGLMLGFTSQRDLRPFDLFSLQLMPSESLHEAAEVAHAVNAWLIALLVCMHVLAALYHHFVRRDDVLKRMLPFVRT